MTKRTPNLPSPRNDRFAQVPSVNMPRSVFSRTSGYKTAFNQGDLIPFFTDEVLPGDTFRLDTQLFGRLSTLLHPYMDNVYLDTQFFFVPNRLVWENWERFCGSQDNPSDSTDYLIPQVAPEADSGGFGAGSIFDYLGIPPNVEGISINALYTRAYNLIYNEYYRDQNLQDSIPVPVGDDDDDPADFVLRKRGKRHDYFTSSLPWPQKGPSVGIPLTGNAPVVFPDDSLSVNRVESSAGVDLGALNLGAAGNPHHNLNVPLGGFHAGVSITGDATDVYADMSGISSVTINAFRQAYAMQRFFEKDARGGTRYFEILQSHFGTTSPDSRLQRPEYLGGGSTRIDVHTVAQTSETDGTPLGELAGFATIMPNRHGFVKSFVEHGMIIGLVSVRADMTYQQGIERRFSRMTRPDFYWPSFAQLGEQAVLNKEIYAQGEIADNDVFGYQERYAEYRYKPSIVTGAMRSSYPQSLDTWHLAYDFANLPVLGEEFIEENPPLNRILAVESSIQPQVILDCYHKLKCARPMPLYGVPGLGDRF